VIWGKTAKCSGRRRGLYRTPTFCHGSYYNLEITGAIEFNTIYYKLYVHIPTYI
jgi:hypothetical protein